LASQFCGQTTFLLVPLRKTWKLVSVVKRKGHPYNVHVWLVLQYFSVPLCYIFITKCQEDLCIDHSVVLCYWSPLRLWVVVKLAGKVKIWWCTGICVSLPFWNCRGIRNKYVAVLLY